MILLSQHENSLWRIGCQFATVLFTPSSCEKKKQWRYRIYHIVVVQTAMFNRVIKIFTGQLNEELKCIKNEDARSRSLTRKIIRRRTTFWFMKRSPIFKYRFFYKVILNEGIYIAKIQEFCKENGEIFKKTFNQGCVSKEFKLFQFLSVFVSDLWWYYLLIFVCLVIFS